MLLIPALGEVKTRMITYNRKISFNENLRFGKLELVDKEIFYISFNTRDN